MSEGKFVAGSIGELLVAIAAGVRDAQDALNSAPPLDAFGRPAPTYHLPFVDFEFKVDIETQASGNKPTLFARPVQDSARSISSTVSGRLVAIPPSDGRPTLLLNLDARARSARQHEITVIASNSAGEILAGASIELNLDADASRRLSEASGVRLTGLGATRLESALLVTDDSGRASTVLDIDANLPAQATVLVRAEMGPGSASLSLPAGGGR